MEQQRAAAAKTIWRKPEQEGLPHLMILYVQLEPRCVGTTSCVALVEGYTDQNKLQKPEMDPHKYAQQTGNKGAKATTRLHNCLSQTLLKPLNIHRQKQDPQHQSHGLHKTAAKMDHGRKCKINKSVGGKKRQKLFGTQDKPEFLHLAPSIVHKQEKLINWASSKLKILFCKSPC